MAETLNHLARHWEEKRTAGVRSRAAQAGEMGLTIAICREAGTQGTAVAQAVGKSLGWPVYDHELLERIAQDMGVHTRLLESVDERRVSWLQEAFEGLMSVPYASTSAYVRRLAKAVLALGAHGECVIVGRAAAFILPHSTALRVRLIAPLEERVAVVSKRLDVPPEKARHEVERLDRERNQFVRANFRKDPADLRDYDLVCNFARLGVAGCAESVLAAAKCLQRTATPRAENVAAKV
jgi:cytidylate kinase